jgi:hypothetical protein
MINGDPQRLVGGMSVQVMMVAAGNSASRRLCEDDLHDRDRRH